MSTKAYTPKKGFIRNPLKRLSRNAFCLCGCGIPSYVEKDKGEKAIEFLDNLTLDAQKAIGHK